MISHNLERIINGFTRQFIPHLCNAGLSNQFFEYLPASNLFSERLCIPTLREGVTLRGSKLRVASVCDTLRERREAPMR
ncbi:MAG: hypothetical protein ACYTXF_37095 [Nostoc sp.]